MQVIYGGGLVLSLGRPSFQARESESMCHHTLQSEFPKCFLSLSGTVDRVATVTLSGAVLDRLLASGGEPRREHRAKGAAGLSREEACGRDVREEELERQPGHGSAEPEGEAGGTRCPLCQEVRYGGAVAPHPFLSFLLELR
ncbi:hypothetical protein NDU88_006369 [Pleurodeles waltl]|uniref:Uncharacterized protein n=1 Tax=Pleurodeles waltl TaxID=8319 RepID=A0AAV7WEI7_PLEWA|nr:hypothetical protein NDU88_006369 [Pleurodeles waltl]